MTENSDTQHLIDALAAELGVDLQETQRNLGSPLKDQLDRLTTADVEKMSPEMFKDLSLLSASLGEWDLASVWAQRAIPFFQDRELEALKLWEMRIQFEKNRFSEVVALAGAHGAPKFLQKEFHYLLGEAFLALRMFEKARQRFEAVARVDAKYRDVEFQLRELRKSLG